MNMNSDNHNNLTTVNIVSSNSHNNNLNSTITSINSNFSTNILSSNVKILAGANSNKCCAFLSNNIVPPTPPPAPPISLFKPIKIPLRSLQARAKTVRIGKVRWPPPLKETETFENELQRSVFFFKIFFNFLWINRYSQHFYEKAA